MMKCNHAVTSEGVFLNGVDEMDDWSFFLIGLGCFTSNV